MLKNDVRSTRLIQRVLSMPDSDAKLKKVIDLQLKAEPFTKLHQQLLDEGNRLLSGGYAFW